MLAEEGRKASPPDELSYEGFILHIDGVKSMRDLIERIDAYDPYNYQIIMAYDANSLWCGVKIKIQFYKGKPIYMVPKIHSDTVYVPMSTSLLSNKKFTVLKGRKEKNGYDNNGSVSGTN